MFKIALATLLVAPLIASDAGLIAHEWGTFTSVAGPDGYPVSWAPLSGPSDLPCFVRRLGPWNVKSMMGLVRMETPVLYFYAPQALTLSVQVGFPKGRITEWYPHASRVEPEQSIVGFRNGLIEWDQVQVLPGKNLQFPEGKETSHYYAARNTDSAPLRIGDQQEKLLFYRGIGNFPPQLHPTFTSDGKVQIRNVGEDIIPRAILFENRNGKIGYRQASSLKETIKLDAPELSADLGQLRQELADALVEFGLYRKEALAMIETWRDSWFEEGMRVFYIVPRPTVDALLPLKVTPAPSEIARVFVGRVEFLSPAMEQAIETALATGDVPTLTKFGRFLGPFAAQIRRRNPLVTDSLGAQVYVQRALGNAQQKLNTISCAQ